MLSWWVVQAYGLYVPHTNVKENRVLYHLDKTLSRMLCLQSNGACFRMAQSTYSSTWFPKTLCVCSMILNILRMHQKWKSRQPSNKNAMFCCMCFNSRSRMCKNRKPMFLHGSAAKPIWKSTIWTWVCFRRNNYSWCHKNHKVRIWMLTECSSNICHDVSRPKWTSHGNVL